MNSLNYLAKPILKIDGQDASLELMGSILRIEVEASLSVAGMFSITIKNDYFPGQESEQPWQFQETFAIGKSVEIGFASSTTQDPNFSQENQETVITGEITAIEVNFTSQAQATTIIRGYDISHRLYRGFYNRSFQNKTDSDIVKQIAGEVGITLGTVDESGGPYGYGDINENNGYLFQHNQTNIEFLRERAAHYGFELFVQAGKLNFRKPNADNTLELEWLKDIYDLNIRVISSEQVSNVEVRGWDYNQKTTLVSQKNTPSSQVITSTEFGQGKSSSSAFNGQPNSPTLRIFNQPIYSADEGDKIAQAICDEIAREFVRAEAIGEGNPNICLGKAIKLTGMGKYSGQYYITETRHRYEKGNYTTEFSVSGIRGEELNQFLASPHQQKALMVLVGVVSNNQDPKKWGRVRVKFPTLTEEHESYWARVVGVGAGSKRGFDCLPEVNDEVLVIFEQGDIQRPYVIGGVWNGKDAPPETVDDSVVEGKVRLRTLKTRTGHMLQFIEEDKNAQKKGVSVTTVYGHQIYLNDSEKKIEIKTNEGHTICLDDQQKQIEIKTSQGAKAKMLLKSTTGEINIQAGTKLTLNAGQIDISATGIVTIKGSLIQLN